MKNTISDIKGFSKALDAALIELGKTYNVRAWRNKIKFEECTANFKFSCGGFTMVHIPPVTATLSPQEKFKKSKWGSEHLNWLEHQVLYQDKKFVLVGTTSHRVNARAILSDGCSEVIASICDVHWCPRKRALAEAKKEQ